MLAVFVDNFLLNGLELSYLFGNSFLGENLPTSFNGAPGAHTVEGMSQFLSSSPSSSNASSGKVDFELTEAQKKDKNFMTKYSGFSVFTSSRICCLVLLAAIPLSITCAIASAATSNGALS